MDDVITRSEHLEFMKRMEEHNKRQDRRIDLLEQSTERMNALVMSVEKLATNMENMLKEQEQQGERLSELEGRDGEMLRKVLGHCVTVVVGIIIGYVFKQLGM